MPRVTQEYLDARRQQILEAARRCFLRDGFHRTSMQDILKEANLSAGAVYRYFPAKDDIVEAIAGTVFAAFLDLITEAPRSSPSPGIIDVVEGLFEIVDRLQRERQLPAIALQVWAESLRDVRLSKLFRDLIDEIAGQLEILIEHSQREGTIPPALPPRDLAFAITLLIEGYVVQVVALGPDISDRSRVGIRALLDPRALAHETT